jgi:hypothetical protein
MMVKVDENRQVRASDDDENWHVKIGDDGENK